MMRVNMASFSRVTSMSGNGIGVVQSRLMATRDEINTSCVFEVKVDR